MAAGVEKYRDRIAFDIWINDVRNQAMTLENWPYGVLDDQTVDGIIRALDLQSAAGYNIVDLCGLWTTYGWPVDIAKVADRDRQRRIHQILKAAHERGMKVICFPSGILNWGFDQILAANPGLATDNKHELNPLKEESWQWVYKVFDYAADNYDIDGFHLEAADQGRCKTAECMQKWPDNVAYYCDVTGRLADHLREKYPGKLRIAAIQGFGQWGIPFSAEQRGYLVALSSKLDGLFDQGHNGTYIPPADWNAFIPQLHCAYGTSGGQWIYVNERWERSRWFLPYVQRTAKHMKELYQAGGRGVMYYQGPVSNASMEVNMDFGGRMMSNIERPVEQALEESLEHLYQPRNASALGALAHIYQQAEDIYFEQWKPQRIQQAIHRPAPSNFHITNSFGASPGSSEYLMEPFLDTEGRLRYKQGLISLFKALSAIDRDFHDGGRIQRIKSAISETLVDLNNIARCLRETAVWDDQKVGLKY